MGITLDLRLIDHERITVRGLEVLNAAIRQNDPELLRAYLAEMPIEINQEDLELRIYRLAKLRESEAPAVIIEHEERLLRFATGEAYRPSVIRCATFDELRTLLGSWCWVTRRHSLDKGWTELQWFLEPRIGPIYPLCLVSPIVGDPKQSVFDKAFHGAVPYPTDAFGVALFGTIERSQEGRYGYNPPEIARLILDSLDRVDSATWTDHAEFRRELYREDSPGLDEDEIARRVENDLMIANERFADLLDAYKDAAAKGYGVSCEYSL